MPTGTRSSAGAFSRSCSWQASCSLLGRALQSLPVGTAYAVCTGIGAVGTVLMGIVLFDETVDAVRLGGIALVVAGIATLKLSAG